jgi:hypothetical protein
VLLALWRAALQADLTLLQLPLAVLADTPRVERQRGIGRGWERQHSELHVSCQ